MRALRCGIEIIAFLFITLFWLFSLMQYADPVQIKFTYAEYTERNIYLNEIAVACSLLFHASSSVSYITLWFSHVDRQRFIFVYVHCSQSVFNDWIFRFVCTQINNAIMSEFMRINAHEIRFAN